MASMTLDALIRWPRVAAWTIAYAVFLGIACAGAVAKDAVLVSIGATGGGFLIGFSVMRKAPLAARLIPLLAAPTLVALWPLYLWQSTGRTDAGKGYLLALAIVGVLVLINVGLHFAQRRRWIVESARRQRMNVAGFLLLVLKSLIGWPTGNWGDAVSYVLLAALTINMFWRPRQRVSHPPAAA